MTHRSVSFVLEHIARIRSCPEEEEVAKFDLLLNEVPGFPEIKTEIQ